MASVGVRELRQSASELLRRVERGERIEITNRGRPIAVLAPLPDPSPLQHLREVGDVTAATGSFKDLSPPLEPVPGATLPSEALRRLRGDER